MSEDTLNDLTQEEVIGFISLYQKLDFLDHELDKISREVGQVNRATTRSLRNAIKEVESSTMFLPKDMNGEPIRIGSYVKEHEDGHTFKVDGMTSCGSTDDLWVFQNEGIQAPARDCSIVDPIIYILQEYDESQQEGIDALERDEISQDVFAEGLKSLRIETADKIRKALA